MREVWQRDEAGAALITGLIIMTGLAVLGAAAFFTADIDRLITKNYEGSIQALYAAEAGAEKVFNAFKMGDTTGDGAVDGNDTANTDNDLDGDGTIDFLQVFANKEDIGSDDNRIVVNSGDTRAFIWVDASEAPTLVYIHSRGNPAGTKNRKDITLALTTSGANIINGALNNAP
ncbi:MAG: hypothetical protein D6736_16230 [Nitrospinota bacterium]|nr:MAG: hypothetical protein D6736_16230 [Nitrospinota bacterium]